MSGRALLRRRLPDLILKVTDPIAFDAPELPSENDLKTRAGEGDAALRGLLDGFRNAASDMNTRCNTAAPTASLILVIAGVLRTSLNKNEWLSVVLVVLAGIAVFAAITGLSVAVPFHNIGFPPKPDHAADELLALRRKEAWARLASGTASVALVALGLAAVLAT